MTTYPQKITFGELRASGVRHVLVYCRDHKCSHHIEVSADRWPDHVRLSDIEPNGCTSGAFARAHGRPYIPTDFTMAARLSSWCANAVQLREIFVSTAVRRAEFLGLAPSSFCCAA
jgi:hypothetical protein